MAESMNDIEGIRKDLFAVNEKLMERIRKDPLAINEELMVNGEEPIAYDIVKLDDKRIEEISKMMKQEFIIKELENEIKEAQAENNEISIIDLVNKMAPRKVLVKQFKSDIKIIEKRLEMMFNKINECLSS